jgi:hypothetical protein
MVNILLIVIFVELGEWEIRPHNVCLPFSEIWDALKRLISLFLICETPIDRVCLPSTCLRMV